MKSTGTFHIEKTETTKHYQVVLGGEPLPQDAFHRRERVAHLEERLTEARARLARHEANARAMRATLARLENRGGTHPITMAENQRRLAAAEQGVIDERRAIEADERELATFRPEPLEKQLERERAEAVPWTPLTSGGAP